jgi:DNA-binding NarL/FixJ family response regulator
MEAVSEHQPNVLITETRIGNRDVLKSLEKVMEAFDNLKVIVYSAKEDSTHIARAAALGCYEYLPKTESCERLLSVVCNAIAGDPTTEDSLLKTTRTRMHRRKLAGAGTQNIPLTNREFQVLSHIAMGMSNREIGRSLEISVETVKEHVQNVLKKLEVNDRTQAAVYAIRNGWC